MSEAVKSLRATIESAIDTSAEPAQEAAAPTSSPPPAEAESPSESVAAAAPSADSKAEAKPSEGKPDAPTLSPEQKAKSDAAKLLATGPKAVKMPPGFPDVRDWETMPAGVKTWVKNREAQFNQGIQRNTQAANFGNAAYEAMRPYEAALRASNTNPVQLIQEFAATHYLLTQGTPDQKKEAIIRAAERHGISLNDLAQHQPAPQVAPEVQALQRQVYEMSQALNGRNQQQSAAQQQQMMAHVDKFVSDPQREHIDVLFEPMAQLIERGLASSLEDAYEKALWSRPDTRAIQMEKDAARRANEARNARSQSTAAGNSSVVGSAPVAGESLRDTISRAFGSARL